MIKNFKKVKVSPDTPKNYLANINMLIENANNLSQLNDLEFMGIKTNNKLLNHLSENPLEGLTATNIFLLIENLNLDVVKDLLKHKKLYHFCTFEETNSFISQIESQKEKALNVFREQYDLIIIVYCHITHMQLILTDSKITFIQIVTSDPGKKYDQAVRTRIMTLFRSLTKKLGLNIKLPRVKYLNSVKQALDHNDCAYITYVNAIKILLYYGKHNKLPEELIYEFKRDVYIIYIKDMLSVVVNAYLGKQLMKFREISLKSLNLDEKEFNLIFKTTFKHLWEVRKARDYFRKYQYSIRMIYKN